MGAHLGTSPSDWWYSSKGLALPVCLLVQCFLGCSGSVSLVCSLHKLLLLPLLTHLLHPLILLLPPGAAALAMLLQLPKAHDQALGCQLGGRGLLPSHQGLTLIAIWEIVHAGALVMSPVLGTCLILEPALLR